MSKKQFLSFLFLLLTVSGFCQIIVKNDVYKASFSNKYHQPIYVCYTLYKGGGDCDRAKFHFKNDDTRLQTATDEDYDKKGYDKGHLANAEDFAFDCAKDELTFRYYNCLPQKANLNRGVWKTNETKIREWSQTDHLFIICGGVFGTTKMGNVSVPNYCWKVVQSITTKKVLFCGWFANTTTATVEEITVAELEKRLKSKINLHK